jgi:hypothetical protein
MPAGTKKSYVFVRTDPFLNAPDIGEGLAVEQNINGATNSNIRRPYRGIQIKDETFAVLSVIKGGTNEPIPLMSSSAVGQKGPGRVDAYSDFILQRVEDQRMEKQQIIETFGDVFIYFFGERPRIVTFGGLLMNTSDFNWRSQFWSNYDQFIRGTKLVENNARCCLAYDTIVLEGYVLSAQAVDTDDAPYSIPFTMSMVLTNYHDYSTPVTTAFPGKATANQLDVANAALKKMKGDDKFVSVGAQVRKLNMEASGSKSLLNTIRSGINTVNNMMNNGGLLTAIAGGLISTAADVLSGRAMRLPIGAGAFVAQLSGTGVVGGNSVSAGGAYLAAGSVASSATTTILNGKTSTTVGKVPVGFKLLMATPGGLASTWASDVTHTSRGYIWENYDEYPMAPEKTLQQLIGGSAYAMMGMRNVARQSAAKEDLFTDSLIDLAASNGSTLGTIAGIVAAARSGFGLLTNAMAALSDPTAFTTSLLGITPNQIVSVATLGLVQTNPVTGQVSLGFAAGKTLAHEASTLVSAMGSLFGNGLSGFGSAVLGQLFQSGFYTQQGQKNTAKSAGSQTGAASVQPGSPTASDVTYAVPAGTLIPTTPAPQPVSGGAQTGAASVASSSVQEVYNANAYRSNSTAAQSLNYESAYKDSDYSSLVAQQQSADAKVAASSAEITAGLSTGNSASLQAALDNTYGDTDISQRPDLQTGKSPSELITLYGPGQQTYDQIKRILAAAGSTEDPSTIYTERLISAVRSTVARSAQYQTYGAEVTPESLQQVYSTTGTVQQRKLTDDQRALLLQLVYGTDATNPPADTDTSGITGVGEDSAPINPIA